MEKYIRFELQVIEQPSEGRIVHHMEVEYTFSRPRRYLPWKTTNAKLACQTFIYGIGSEESTQLAKQQGHKKFQTHRQEDEIFIFA
ncbi:hypothetical protein FPOAC1_001562 [Fusarium poae]|uniref:hypothetical protein n=1 Tax=Fusarium poae TaxID=36050 RepID=UPI001CEA2E54|nr:hypothetical protein FPOAC1_001562 [Fusarium poae]KAG8675581.1 hypothetical protein FPOAC1_001562 [Fusarium poae]